MHYNNNKNKKTKKQKTSINYSTYVQPENEFRQVYWYYQIVLF